MSLTVKELRTALKQLAPAKIGPTSIRVLAAVRFEDFTVSATNMETWVRAPLASGVTAAVTRSELVSLLKGHPASAEVELSTDGDVLVVKIGRVESRLATFPQADLPEWPKDDKPIFSVSIGAEHAESIRGCVDAASRDLTRPVLTGVGLRLSEDGTTLTIAATDSYRLNLLEVPVTAIKKMTKADRGRKAQPIVHASALKAIAGACTIEVGHQFHMIRQGEVGTVVRAIEGEYPDWEKLIPTDYPINLPIEPDGVETARIMAGSHLGKSRQTPLRLRLMVGLHAVSLELRGDDEASVVRAAFALSDKFAWEEDVEIGFNAEFFAKAMAYAGTTVQLISPLRPGLFHNGNGRKTLLMPIRLNA